MKLLSQNKETYGLQNLRTREQSPFVLMQDNTLTRTVHAASSRECASGETGDREATLEEAEESEKCVGEKTRDNSSTEESEGKKICS